MSGVQRSVFACYLFEAEEFVETNALKHPFNTFPDSNNAKPPSKQREHHLNMFWLLPMFTKNGVERELQGCRSGNFRCNASPFFVRLSLQSLPAKADVTGQGSKYQRNDDFGFLYSELLLLWFWVCPQGSKHFHAAYKGPQGRDIGAPFRPEHGPHSYMP